MAETVYSLIRGSNVIKIKLECVNTKLQSELITKVRGNNSVLQSDRDEISDLELQLDIVELQELHALCTRSALRIYLSYLITQLDRVSSNYHSSASTKTDVYRNWSDIVADRNIQTPETSEHEVHTIETVITERQTSLHRGP
jgi:hypothetical protein